MLCTVGRRSCVSPRALLSLPPPRPTPCVFDFWMCACLGLAPPKTALSSMGGCRRRRGVGGCGGVENILVSSLTVPHALMKTALTTKSPPPPPPLPFPRPSSFPHPPVCRIVCRTNATLFPAAYLDLRVGSPPQTVTAIFDTGSSTLALGSPSTAGSHAICPADTPLPAWMVSHPQLQSQHAQRALAHSFPYSLPLLRVRAPNGRPPTWTRTMTSVSLARTPLRARGRCTTARDGAPSAALPLVMIAVALLSLMALARSALTATSSKTT